MARKSRQAAPFGHVTRALGLAHLGQLGFIVADVERACRRHGPELGVAAWYRPEIRRQEHVAGGRSLDQRFEIAVGYAGGVQIEILSVAGADRDCLQPGALTAELRLHHIGVFVVDVSASEARLAGLGYATLQSGWFSFAPRSKTRVAYLDTRGPHGVIVELIENRLRGWSIGMPEWYVRFGVVAGHVRRLR